MAVAHRPFNQYTADSIQSKSSSSTEPTNPIKPPLPLPQLLIPPDRQKRQRPKLPHIGLSGVLARRRRQRAQRRELEIIISVRPAPDFGAEVLGIGFEGVPEVVVGCKDPSMDGGVGAEIWNR